MFVTFLKDAGKILENPYGDEIGPFERGDTVDVKKEQAKNLLEEGSAVRWAWRCLHCGEIHRGYDKPPACGNPNCRKKAFKPLHPTEPYQIARVLLQNYDFATVRESVRATQHVGKIFRRNAGVLKAEGTEGFIRQKTDQIKPDASTAQEKEVVKKIETRTQHPQSHFGLRPPRVMVENGVLNVETGVLDDPTNFGEDELPISKMPVKWDPHADYTQWEAHLKEIMPDKDDRLTLQEFLGTALVNAKLHKKMMMIIGPTDSGKSTLISAIRHVIGRDNTQNQSPKALADTRWAVDKIFGKKLNVTDEVGTSKIYRLDKIKLLADGNPIVAERKSSPTYSFEPTTEHLFATNQTPAAERTDDAFWNRWIITETPRSIPQEEQDKLKVEKLKKLAPGILRWIVEGYQRFIQNERRFTKEPHWTETRDRWMDWGSSVDRFIKKMIVEKPGNVISCHEIYEAYTDFTEDLELERVEQQVLTKEIQKLGFAKYGQYTINGKRPRGFKHVALREEPNTIEKIEDFWYNHGDPEWTIDEFLDRIEPQFDDLTRKELLPYVLKLREDGRITLLDQGGVQETLESD